MRFRGVEIAAEAAEDSAAYGLVADAPGFAEIESLCRPFLLAAAKIPGYRALSAALRSLRFDSIDSPELSGPGSLTFLGPKTPLRVRRTLRAALIIAEAEAGPLESDGFFNGLDRPDIPILRVTSMHAAMAALLAALSDRFHYPTPHASGPGNRIAPGASVHGCLEGDVMVEAGAYVDQGAYIGAGSRIGPNAVIQGHCRIGRGCVIQAGAVIGCDGFGFFPAPAGSQARGLMVMPHPAGVEIGEDCWIGANAVVAAGVLNSTVLGRGCKLDSHVQIAHNVRLGDDCLLASQSGIAGSTVAGHRLRMGGAAKVDGHLLLGNDVSVAACSGVTKDWADGAVVAGFPARPIREWRRGQIRLKALGRPDAAEPDP